MKLRQRHARGQSLVEFALILPIFVLLLVGIFDFGRAIYAFNTINNAAREGARLAVVDQTVTHIQEEAAKGAVSLGIGDADIEVEFVNNTTGAACTVINTNRASECSAIVRVPYSYQAATPLIGNLVGVIPMEGMSQFRIDVNCVEPTAPKCPLGS